MRRYSHGLRLLQHLQQRITHPGHAEGAPSPEYSPEQPAQNATLSAHVHRHSVAQWNTRMAVHKMGRCAQSSSSIEPCMQAGLNERIHTSL